MKICWFKFLKEWCDAHYSAHRVVLLSRPFNLVPFTLINKFVTHVDINVIEIGIDQMTPGYKHLRPECVCVFSDRSEPEIYYTNPPPTISRENYIRVAFYNDVGNLVGTHEERTVCTDIGKLATSCQNILTLHYRPEKPSRAEVLGLLNKLRLSVYPFSSQLNYIEATAFPLVSRAAEFCSFNTANICERSVFAFCPIFTNLINIVEHGKHTVVPKMRLKLKNNVQFVMPAAQFSRHCEISLNPGCVFFMPLNTNMLFNYKISLLRNCGYKIILYTAYTTKSAK